MTGINRQLTVEPLATPISISSIVDSKDPVQPRPRKAKSVVGFPCLIPSNMTNERKSSERDRMETKQSSFVTRAGSSAVGRR